MAKKKLLQLLEEELNPFLTKEGYVLYHTEFIKEGKDWFLRIYIEVAPTENGLWPGNVSTDDCEKVSRFIGSRLDELDPIEQNYFLEVSSPGMDRPLFKEEHFVRYEDQLVDIKLYESLNGKKALTGKLVGHSDEFIDIEDETGALIHILREKISKVKLTVVF